MKIGRIKIQASRWPWMQQGRSVLGGDRRHEKYGWGSVGGMGRFGGGWDWKLGFAISSRTLMIDLLWGMIMISFERKQNAS